MKILFELCFPADVTQPKSLRLIGVEFFGDIPDETISRGDSVEIGLPLSLIFGEVIAVIESDEERVIRCEGTIQLIAQKQEGLIQ